MLLYSYPVYKSAFDSVLFQYHSLNQPSPVLSYFYTRPVTCLP